MQPSEKIITEYSVLGSDLYYHHTLTPAVGYRYFHSPRAHAEYELLYLLSGELSYVIEGKTYRVTEGDMIFVAPNEIHTLNVNGDVPYERIVLLFDMSILHSLTEKLGTSLHSFTQDGKNEFHVIPDCRVREYGLDRILYEIIDERVDPCYKKLDIISKLIRFVIEIDRLMTASDTRPKEPDGRDALVSSVIEYVDSHINEPIRLDRLSDELYVSKSTLCHRFSSLMNVSVNRYIAMKKIYHASELISGGMSALSAAASVGYDNYASFFYNYKRIIGKAPTEKD